MGVSERKIRERHDRREEILNGAERVFEKKGIPAATIDDIAREAELGKGTLYNYFPSKESILWYCAIRGMKILKSQITKSISPENEPLVNLGEMARSFLRFAGEYGNYFRVFLHVGMGFSIPAGISSSEVKEIFESESPYGLIRSELIRGREIGFFRTDIDINLLAHAVWIQFYSFMQLISLNPDLVQAFRLDHEKLITANLQLMINGIRNTK
jgi:AcrR family transcriptional regulator